MREEKQLLLDEIKGQVEAANALILLSYHGINPDLAHDFRMRIANTGGGMTVVSKRIFCKAVSELGLTIDNEILQGHLAFIYSGEDVVGMAKTVFDFRKENAALINVLLGHFEGKLCSAEDVEQIAKLPDKDQMRAELLGLLEAPLSTTLSLFEALLTSVVYCLDNKEKA